ncbi:MAG TPA: group 1 truncated hemoglobin [Myxococcaceae bacterium]|nr:group 1 truncated hemoglobin [Myxococcaceae bacterium]
MRMLCWMLCTALLAACSHAKPKAPATAAAPADAPRDPPTKAGALPPAASSKPLFERLGGEPAIEAVVTDFMKNVAADERINAHFAVSDLELLHKRLVEFICVATGGPCKYGGRSMLESHRGMGITKSQFAAIAEDLVKTLDTLHVPEKEKGEVLGAVAPLSKDIVEVE